MDILATLIADVLGGAVITFLAKAVGRVAGGRRARVQTLLERFGHLSSDLRMLMLVALIFAAAVGAGVAFGFGPAFIALGLMVILLIATYLLSGLGRVVAERMAEDNRESAWQD